MPQTRFVLQKALEIGLKPIVVINKIDRPNARIDEVLHETQDLFLELASDADQLDFPILFSIARDGVAVRHLSDARESLQPLFQTIVDTVPPPAIQDGPFQMLVTTLGYDSYQGRIAIGRVVRGSVRPNDTMAVIGRLGSQRTGKVAAVFTFENLQRSPVDEARAGDIVAITGIEDASIGETIASIDAPDALPSIDVEEPTVRMTIGVNTSPFSGREGTLGSSRQLRQRLFRELLTNVALRVDETDRSDVFLVSGRVSSTSRSWWKPCGAKDTNLKCPGPR